MKLNTTSYKNTLLFFVPVFQVGFLKYLKYDTVG